MRETVLRASACQISDCLPEICGKELQKGENPTQALTLISNDHGYVETLSTKQDRSTSRGRAREGEPKIFDEVTRQIWSDPLFTNAILNWEFGVRNLWKECNRLGFERVRSEILFVQKKTGLNSKGKYLRKVLASMD